MKSLLSCILLLGTVQAATVKTYHNDTIKITFHNQGENSMGMKSLKNWTPDQIKTIEKALSTWTKVIKNKPARQIHLSFYFNDFTNIATSRAIYLPVDPKSNKLGYNKASSVELVWRENKNAQTPGVDFQVVVNPNLNLYTGTGKPGRDQMDLESMIAHELGHALGFMSCARPNGQFDGKMAFDKLMISEGKPLGNSYPFGRHFSLGNSGLNVYNPSRWSQGSSMSHVVDKNKKPSLMKYSLTYGEVNRTLTPLEIKVMEMMGWTVK